MADDDKKTITGLSIAIVVVVGLAVGFFIHNKEKMKQMNAIRKRLNFAGKNSTIYKVGWGVFLVTLLLTIHAILSLANVCDKPEAKTYSQIILGVCSLSFIYILYENRTLREKPKYIHGDKMEKGIKQMRQKLIAKLDKGNKNFELTKSNNGNFVYKTNTTKPKVEPQPNSKILRNFWNKKTIKKLQEGVKVMDPQPVTQPAS